MNIKTLSPVYYTKQSSTSTTHNFYIDTAIQYAEMYRELINVLLTAPAQDEVHIFLSTPGGSVDIGIAIVNAIRNSKAKVVGHLLSICHSMGTFIFLECDEFVVNEDVHLLFHAYSGWNFGKGADTVIAAEANHKWLSTFFRKVYYPFFTMEEIDDLMPTTGKGATDMYLDAAEVAARLENVLDHRAELAEKAEQEQIDLVVREAKKYADKESAEVCATISEEIETTEEYTDS